MRLQIMLSSVLCDGNEGGRVRLGRALVSVVRLRWFIDSAMYAACNWLCLSFSQAWE